MKRWTNKAGLWAAGTVVFSIGGCGASPLVVPATLDAGNASPSVQDDGVQPAAAPGCLDLTDREVELLRSNIAYANEVTAVTLEGAIEGVSRICPHFADETACVVCVADLAAELYLADPPAAETD